jgi:hypothetical protein
MEGFRMHGNNENIKVTISGNLVEVQILDRSPSPNNVKGGRRTSSISQEREIENFKKCAFRSIKKIRQLLESNFRDHYQFVTLTFNDKCDFDISDINICNKKFNCFKARLRYWLTKNAYPEFKYIAIIEFQDKNNRGAVHYHLFCNLYGIKAKELELLWKYGFVNSQYVKSSPFTNQKLINYLSKGIFDLRLAGVKKYLTSTNLIKPIELRGVQAKDFIENIDNYKFEVLLEETYDSPIFGKVFLGEYYINNNEEVMNYV